MKLLRFEDKDGNDSMIYTDQILKFQSDGNGKTRIFLDFMGDEAHLLDIGMEELVKKIHDESVEIIQIPEEITIVGFGSESLDNLIT